MVKKAAKDNQQEYATPEDIELAVESLSRAEERRLEKAARFRIRGLGRKATYRDHDDLYGKH